MAAYVIGLENMGYTLIHDIQVFNQTIGQPSTGDVVFNIYREIISQIVACYSNNSDQATMLLYEIPTWPTILFVEDSHEFFDAKREFAAKVRHFALTLFAVFKEKLPLDPSIPFTVLMDSVTSTLLIVNAYLDAENY